MSNAEYGTPELTHTVHDYARSAIDFLSDGGDLNVVAHNLEALRESTGIGAVRTA